MITELVLIRYPRPITPITTAEILGKFIFPMPYPIIRDRSTMRKVEVAE